MNKHSIININKIKISSFAILVCLNIISCTQNRQEESSTSSLSPLIDVNEISDTFQNNTLFGNVNKADCSSAVSPLSPPDTYFRGNTQESLSFYIISHNDKYMLECKYSFVSNPNSQWVNSSCFGSGCGPSLGLQRNTDSIEISYNELPENYFLLYRCADGILEVKSKDDFNFSPQLRNESEIQASDSNYKCISSN